MATSERPQPWEVWYADVRFEDDPGKSKARPVLILADRTAFILSLKITSHPPRAGYYGEYRLLRWKEAGLSKPSTVRASKKLRLEERDFLGRAGRLEPADILNIIRILSNRY